MTAQFPDEIRYRGRLYAITAIDGRGLFDAVEHGLEPGMLSTACWRGVWCRYAVRRGRLTLMAVQLGRSTAPARPLFGVAPHQSSQRDRHPGAWQYHRLDAPIPFTGRVLIGAGYVYLGRPAMGFAPAWLYERVHELCFTRGRLTSTHNRSAQLAMVRHRLGTEGLQPGPDEPSGAWVDRTFSLTFAYSWPRTPPYERRAQKTQVDPEPTNPRAIRRRGVQAVNGSQGISDPSSPRGNASPH